MPNYKNILVGYVNKSDRGGEYLKITNVSDEPITIEPDGAVFLTKTPDDIRQKYPKTPHFKKSVKIEEEVQKVDPKEVDPMDIPF